MNIKTNKLLELLIEIVIATHDYVGMHTYKEKLKEIVENESAKTHALNRKYYLTIALAVAMAAVIVPYSLYVTSLIGEEHRIITTSKITSGYVIQNLKGDIITTWLSWRLTDGDILHVHIMDADKYPEKN